MSCRFRPPDYDVTDLKGRHLRALEITFPNGVVAVILVSEEPCRASDGFWHYEISHDGKSITLANQEGNSSVRVLDIDGREKAHDMITGWPLQS